MQGSLLLRHDRSATRRSTVFSHPAAAAWRPRLAFSPFLVGHRSLAGDLAVVPTLVLLVWTGNTGLFLPLGFALLVFRNCLTIAPTPLAARAGRAGGWSLLFVAAVAWLVAAGRAPVGALGAALALGCALGGANTALWRRDATIGRLRSAALHDALTGLPNRLLLCDRLDQALARARRRGALVGVLYLDLGRFKDVNDTLGHAAGDELLRLVAARLAGRMRAGDTVARLGGDEFACVLTDLARPEDAATVARKLLDALDEPFMVRGRPRLIAASVGTSVFPADGEDAAALLHHADLAMYQAKQPRRGARAGRRQHHGRARFGVSGARGARRVPAASVHQAAGQGRQPLPVR